MVTVTQLADALQSVFTGAADQAARDAGFIRRQRRLTGSAFAQGLVFTWMGNADATCEELASGVAAAGCPLAASSLHERFTPQAADFLRALLERAAGLMVAADPVAVGALGRFADVLIDDASTIALPAALAGLWPGCGGSTPESCPAALKVYPRFSLRTGALARLRLAPGRCCDQTCDAQRDHPPAEALSIGDLGFFSLDVMQARAERGAYFLSKVQAGTLLAGAGGDSAGVLAHLKGCKGRKLDKPVRLGKHHRIEARLLAVRLPKAAAKKRRRRVWEEARRKGRTPSAESLALCRWLVLVTNAPAGLLSLAEALALYRARWQIELLFKLWKGLGKIDESRSGKPWRVLCEVYAKLLAMLAQHWLLLLAAWRFDDRSLHKAAKEVRKRAARLLDELGDSEELVKGLGRIVKALGRGCRVQKRRARPSAFQLLRDASLLDCTEALT